MTFLLRIQDLEKRGHTKFQFNCAFNELNGLYEVLGRVNIRGHWRSIDLLVSNI